MENKLTDKDIERIEISEEKSDYWDRMNYLKKLKNENLKWEDSPMNYGHYHGEGGW